MEEKQINAVCDWLDPQSIDDIEVFLVFANFYQFFIQRFNRLAAPLTSILKTIIVEEEVKNPEKCDEKIQVENENEKEPTQKNFKVQKGQKTAKSKNRSELKKRRPPEPKT